MVCINGKSTAFDAAGDEVTFGNAQYREQLASADQLMNPYRTLYASYTQSAWAYKIYILAAKTLIVGSNSLSQTPTIQQLWATGLMGVMGGVTFFTSPYLDRESTTLEWNNRFWTFWLLVSSFITFLPRTGKVLGFVAMGFSLAVLCRGLLEKYWPRAKKIIRRLFPTLKFVRCGALGADARPRMALLPRAAHLPCVLTSNGCGTLRPSGMSPLICATPAAPWTGKRQRTTRRSGRGARTCTPSPRRSRCSCGTRSGALVRGARYILSLRVTMLGVWPASPTLTCALTCGPTQPSSSSPPRRLSSCASTR